MVRLSLLLLSLAGIAACGGGSSGGTGSGAPAGSTPVTVTDFSFKPNNISVPSGKVVFFLINNGPAAHDMLIADSSNKTLARSSLVQSGRASCCSNRRSACRGPRARC